jgi:hypothetical protein
LAQKWDEENCEPQLLLHRLGKVLRENDRNLSGVSRSVSLSAGKQSHSPIRDGLRIASSFESERGEMPSLVARPLSLGWGGESKHLPMQFQSALLLLQSADKSID